MMQEESTNMQNEYLNLMCEDNYRLSGIGKLFEVGQPYRDDAEIIELLSTHPAKKLQIKFNSIYYRGDYTVVRSRSIHGAALSLCCAFALYCRWRESEFEIAEQVNRLFRGSELYRKHLWYKWDNEDEWRHITMLNANFIVFFKWPPQPMQSVPSEALHMNIFFEQNIKKYKGRDVIETM
jgi:hypothetical protein